MEIYKAAQQYQQTDMMDVWMICEDSAEGDFSIRLVSDLFVMNEGIDNRWITRQRGGIRRFKTLDAAWNAMKQIGQDSVIVRAI